MNETYYTTDCAGDEQRHWWYRARRRILKATIKGITLPAHAHILDIGVGAGSNLYSIYPKDARLCGIEPSPALVAIANARGPIPVYKGTAEALPPPLDQQRFDAIAMLDVLEHTEDDSRVLNSVAERLVPGGVLILTVPAYTLLWTDHDVAVGHYRRYRLRPLVRKLRRHRFGIERATYFNALLMVPLAAFRLARRLPKATDGVNTPMSDTQFSMAGLDALLFRIFSLEQYLLKWLNFPAGISILVIARKR